MDKMNQEDHPHTHIKKEPAPHKPPYWHRAHHDWKFWVAILAMLMAMAVYLRSNDLSHRPDRSAPQQPVP